MTNDKDFGGMVFRERRTHRGIVLRRLPNGRAVSTMDALRRSLLACADRLPDARFSYASGGTVKARTGDGDLEVGTRVTGMMERTGNGALKLALKIHEIAIDDLDG